MEGEGMGYENFSTAIKKLIRFPFIHLNLLPVVLALLLTSIQSHAGTKGTLNADEYNFMVNKIDPILVAHGYCTHHHDEQHHAVCLYDEAGFISCGSFDTLSCNVWGVTDRGAIREILLAVLHSNLKIERFTFWNIIYDPPFGEFKTHFEKPIADYIDSTRKN